MKVFIDTNIPMYAAGKEHPLKAGCLEVLTSIARGELDAYTDTEVLQEILYRYFSINRRETGLQVFDLFSRIMNGAVLSVHYQDLLLARRLCEEDKTARLSPRDLLHLGVMLNHNIQHIITMDKGFNGIDFIQVIQPG